MHNNETNFEMYMLDIVLCYKVVIPELYDVSLKVYMGLFYVYIHMWVIAFKLCSAVKSSCLVLICCSERKMEGRGVGRHKIYF